MEIAARVVEIAQAGASGPEVAWMRGAAKAPRKATARKVSWKLASNSWSGSSQEAERDRRQQVQRTALTVEAAADHKQGESGGGAGTRGAPSCDQRIEPDAAKVKSRAILCGTKQMRSRNKKNAAITATSFPRHQRMESAGVAVLFGPDLLQLEVWPIRMACIMPV